MGFELVLFAAALIALPVALRRLGSAADPDWERRWGELPQLQRDRISRAVRRGERLGDPDEAALAVGFAREQRRGIELLTHSSVLHLTLAGVLLLEALFGSLPVVFGLTFLLLAFLIWLAYRDRVTKRNLVRAKALDCLDQERRSSFRRNRF